MKKLISNKNLILLSLCAVLIFTSCNGRNNENFNRAVEVFFLGVLQVINMLIFGVMSLVFCIISGTNGKQVYKILGGIFLGIFTLFCAIGFMNVVEANPRENEIYFIFMMEFAMIVVSLVFVFKKPNKSSGLDDKDKYLEKIIDDTDEVL